MKRAILFFLLVAFSGCLTVYPQKKEAPKRQGWYKTFGSIYGDVDSVSYALSDKFDEIVKEKKCVMVCKFDSKGDVIEKVHYSSNGSMCAKYTYKYDSKGNMIEEAAYHSDGWLRRKYIYKYDSKDNKIEWAEYDGYGSLWQKYIYKYDSQGKKIEWAWYNGNDSLSGKTLYKYDSQGNWIENVSIMATAH